MVAVIMSRLIEQSSIGSYKPIKNTRKRKLSTNQYTHRTVDMIYGAFLENESTKDCHVPSKESNRAKEMPTYIILNDLIKGKKTKINTEMLEHRSV